MPPGLWAMSVMMQTLHPSAALGANSVTSPAGVMLAIFAGAPVNSVPSVNQRLPSEPLVIARGLLLAVGTLNCFNAATGAAATAALPSDSARPPTTTIANTCASRLDIVLPFFACRSVRLTGECGAWFSATALLVVGCGNERRKPPFVLP